MAASKGNGASSSDSDSETLKISPEEFYLPQNSWFKRRILFRLAWLGSLISSVISLPFVALKTAWQLITLSPIKALKTLVLGTLGCIGIGLISAISLFVPSFALRIARAWVNDGLKKSSILTNSGYVCFNVKSDKGNVRTIQTSEPENSNKLLIRFAGLASVFENSNTRSILYRYSGDLKRPARGFNYPGIGPGKLNASYIAKSGVDFVNAACAQIYQFLQANNWQKQALNNIQLVGHSLGGAIALQVAKRLKKFEIDIPVHVDRSFSSLSAVFAAQINRWTHIPLVCSSVIAKAVLYGGGDLELDSLEACEHLRPTHVYWYNLGHVKNGIRYVSPPKTWLRKFLEFVGLGRFSRTLEKIGNVRAFDDADYMIPDGADLKSGLEEKYEGAISEAPTGSTTAIFRNFNVKSEEHTLFDKYQLKGAPGKEQNAALHNDCFFNLETQDKVDAMTLFKRDVLKHDQPEDVKAEQPSLLL